ncbi:MAG: hypothetical protein AB7O04_06260 [Hyphomonadaceae bacterium]
MTITYPRPLPSLRIAGVVFEPEPQEAFSPEQGGRFVSTQLGPTLWTAKYSTTPPSEYEFDLWRSWFASLKGAGRLFYGQDVRRRYPRNYRAGFAGLERAGGGAFDGSVATWSVNETRDELTLETLPISFRLSYGDYIGFRWSTYARTLHRVLEDSNADVSGVGVWTIEPELPGFVPDGATVHLAAPDCLMVITKRDISAEGKDRRVSFEAKQHLQES